MHLAQNIANNDLPHTHLMLSKILSLLKAYDCRSGNKLVVDTLESCCMCILYSALPDLNKAIPINASDPAMLRTICDILDCIMYRLTRADPHNHRQPSSLERQQSALEKLPRELKTLIWNQLGPHEHEILVSRGLRPQKFSEEDPPEHAWALVWLFATLRKVLKIASTPDRTGEALIAALVKFVHVFKRHGECIIKSFSDRGAHHVELELSHKPDQFAEFCKIMYKSMCVFRSSPTAQS